MYYRNRDTCSAFLRVTASVSNVGGRGKSRADLPSSSLGTDIHREGRYTHPLNPWSWRPSSNTSLPHRNPARPARTGDPPALRPVNYVKIYQSQ